MQDLPVGFAAFERKWLVAFPEQAIVQSFLAPAQRPVEAALGCLGFELEQTALAIAEPQVAATKLAWWGEELDRATRQQARHPVSQVLFADPRAGALPPALWQALVSGAMALRSVDSSPDPAAQLDQARRFAAPLAAIETALAVSRDAPSQASARLAAVAQLLRRLRVLPEELQHGRLPLPLSLLARHQLKRADLLQVSVARAAALRDYFALLAQELDVALALGEDAAVGRVVGARLDRAALVRACRRADPLAALYEARPAPWHSLYYAWSAARRLRQRTLD